MCSSDLDSGDPIPAFRADEGGAVETERAAVVAGAKLDGLLAGNTGVRRRSDHHGENVEGAGFGKPRDVELAADKGTGNVAEILAIEPNLSVVIDASELEPERASGRRPAL